jgi:exo-beta-1,3-glucanase (GH17 family)
MSERVQLVENQASGRQIIVTETGWADMGSHPDANVASPENMAKWLQDFLCLANSRNWWYFWFDAYDSDWRRLNEQTPDSVEGHFGTFIFLLVPLVGIRVFFEDVSISFPKEPNFLSAVFNY